MVSSGWSGRVSRVDHSKYYKLLICSVRAFIIQAVMRGLVTRVLNRMVW